MNNILIAISTYNRRDLTAVCLASVMACKEPGTRVVIADDASTEYGMNWLLSFGIDRVDPSNTRGDVGLMARRRMECIAEYGIEYLCLLDNDALVTPGFDTKLRALYEKTKLDGAPQIVTGYRSSMHEGFEFSYWINRDPAEEELLRVRGEKPVLRRWSDDRPDLPDVYCGMESIQYTRSDYADVLRMKDIGGINMFMDRETATYLLDTILPECWDDRWDYAVCEAVPRIFAPKQSWIEHLGRWGGGVNGASEDKAVDFIGWRSHE